MDFFYFVHILKFVDTKFYYYYPYYPFSWYIETAEVIDMKSVFFSDINI